MGNIASHADFGITPLKDRITIIRKNHVIHAERSKSWPHFLAAMGVTTAIDEAVLRVWNCKRMSGNNAIRNSWHCVNSRDNCCAQMAITGRTSPDVNKMTSGEVR